MCEFRNEYPRFSLPSRWREQRERKAARDIVKRANRYLEGLPIDRRDSEKARIIDSLNNGKDVPEIDVYFLGCTF